MKYGTIERAYAKLAIPGSAIDDSTRDARLSCLRPVAHGFDVVAVRIDDERAVVVRVVLGTYARRAIVARTGCERCVVESIDGFPIVTREED